MNTKYKKIILLVVLIISQNIFVNAGFYSVTKNTLSKINNSEFITYLKRSAGITTGVLLALYAWQNKYFFYYFNNNLFINHCNNVFKRYLGISNI